MAEQTGFGQGMDLGLRMFGAMQNAAYMQQLQQNAADANARQQEELQLRQQQFAALQEEREVRMDEFVLSHPESFGRSVTMDALNKMGRRAGGPNYRPITEAAVDAYEANLRGFPAKLAEAQDQTHAMQMLTEMEKQSREHPMLAKSFDASKPVFERIIKERGYYDAAEFLFRDMMDPKERKRFASMPDEVVKKIFTDKDERKAFVVMRGERFLAQLRAGEINPSDAELRDTLAAMRGVGAEIGDKGTEVLKAHDTVKEWDGVAGRLEQARVEFTPLLNGIRLSPGSQDVANMSLKKVGTADDLRAAVGGPLAFYAKQQKDVDEQDSAYQGWVQKNPQLHQAAMQLGQQASPRVADIERRLADIKQERLLIEKDKNRPNRELMMNILDQERDGLMQQRWVYQPLAEYAENPTLQTLQPVLRLQDRLDRADKQVKGIREKAISEDNRISRERVKLEVEKANTDRATAEATMLAMQRVAADPNASDEQRLGIVAQTVKEVGERRGVMPDANEVSKRLVANRTKAEDDTKLKLDSTEASRFSLLQQAERSLQEYKNAITGPDGHYDYKALAQQDLRLPYSDGRTLDVLIMNPITGEMRLESGAAVTPNEWTQKAQQLKGLFLDPEATIDTKLRRAGEHYKNIQNLMDPRGKLRERTEVSPARSRTEILEGHTADQRARERALEKLKQKGAADSFEQFMKAHPDLNRDQAYEKWVAS